MNAKDKWRSHPVLGAIVSSAAIVAPFMVSVATAAVVGRLLPRGHGQPGRAFWWAAVLVSSTAAFFASERLFRRLLPLAALLKMTMLFPDQAPKRLKVAWRAGLTRDLERSSKLEASTNPSVPVVIAEEILALAASISRHDRRTRGHSERVRAFTDLIADELHLPTADRDRLRWSALLHDVGKLSVHPHILNKAGKPTEEEWAEIRNHPLEGRRLVAPLVPWLGQWGLAIEQHHESFDGTGYPFGLSGEEISLGARIVAVADAFEVMTAIRSYKKALSPVAARQELTRCAGSQFDPAIVRALLNVSIGRLRWVVGPVSWVADVPLLARLGVAGHALMTTTQVAVGAAALTAGGVLAVHAATPPPSITATSRIALAAGPTTTTVPPRPVRSAETTSTVTSTVATSTTVPATTRRPALSHGNRTRPGGGRAGRVRLRNIPTTTKTSVGGRSTTSATTSSPMAPTTSASVPSTAPVPRTPVPRTPVPTGLLPTTTGAPPTVTTRPVPTRTVPTTVPTTTTSPVKTTTTVHIYVAVRQPKTSTTRITEPTTHLARDNRAKRANDYGDGDPNDQYHGGAVNDACHDNGKNSGGDCGFAADPGNDTANTNNEVVDYHDQGAAARPSQPGRPPPLRQRQRPRQRPKNPVPVPQKP